MRKNDFNIQKTGLCLLYLSITLEVILVIVDKSNYTNPIEGQLFRITFLLAAGKILCTEYSLREWAAMLAAGIFGFVSYKITGRNEILRIVVFIAACKGADMKKALKYVLYLTAAGCLLLVLLGYRYLRRTVSGNRFRKRIQTDKVLLWPGASQRASLYVYDAGIIGALPV